VASGFSRTSSTPGAIHPTLVTRGQNRAVMSADGDTIRRQRQHGKAVSHADRRPLAKAWRRLTYTRRVRTLILRLMLASLLGAPVALFAQRGVPTPESVLGFRPGADYKLATYDQSVDYFKKIAASSRFVKLVDAGKTTQGRTMYFALVSSPENLARVDRYRELAQRLAHPQGLSETEAHRLAREGKAFVHIDGGLHSTEVAGPQHTPQLLYDLVSRTTDADVKAILDNVILMLWPTINPDGQQMVAEWYMKNVGTPYELSGLPRLYQEYVGHDNNRDGYMLNMIESRVLEHTWRQWEPNIIYVHHQSGPFPTRIWLPPFSEPVGHDVPFLMSREVNMIGMAIAKGLEEHGQVGATHMGTAFDAWYPGYVDYAPNFKNIPSFWTETALYQYATPHEYSLQDFPEEMRDLRPRSLYSSPWPPGWWRLRDAVDYMETASLAVLEYASKYKDSLLLNRYKAGIAQIALGAKKAPYAYFVPQEQHDPVAAVELLRRLAFAGLRIYQLTANASLDPENLHPFTSGTWVIPTDQEFAAMAREVLDVQRYPDLRQYPGGPPERPYDAAGWTLPLQMGVRVVAADRPLPDDMRRTMKLVTPEPQTKVQPTPYDGTIKADAAPFDSVPGIGFDAEPAAAAIAPPPGRVTGDGDILVVDPSENNAFRAINRAWQQGATVHRRGSKYAIRGLARTAQDELVSSLALHAERITSLADERRAGPAAPAPDIPPLKRPRLGVYQPWSGSMDEGWTRWVFDQYGFTYTAVHPEDIKNLSQNLDVLIVADDARLPIAGAATGRGGRGGAAAASARTEVRPEYAYQLTAADLQAVEQFVRGGGTLVCLSNASNVAIQQLKLPVKNVVAGLRPEEFFLRGSIVEVSVDTNHLVMAGMPATAAVFVDGSPVFEVQDGFNGLVLARYAESGSPLLSGYLIGAERLHGKAAALDVSLGDGHVVLLGFRPEWRGQPFGTFRVLFNAALYGR
jgi:zinc carboxypeptidase